MGNIPAISVLNSYWDKSLPVDPVVIATSMGLKVFSLETLKCDAVLTAGAIYYRPSGNSRRDRFTISHMLGHYCLGHSGETHRVVEQNFNVNVHIQEEREANRFAASLLMPEEALRFFVYHQEITDIDTLCQKFDVTSTAMSVRLQQIGIL